MKYCLAIFLFFLLSNCSGQVINVSSNVAETHVSGKMNIPALQSLVVKKNAKSIVDFTGSADLEKGKMIPGFYDIEVKSNVPWLLTVRSENNNFTGTSSPNSDLPVEIISIKKSTDLHYFRLSDGEQQLLENDNQNIVNHYLIDLKLNPAWNYKGDLYNINLVFTLTTK